MVGYTHSLGAEYPLAEVECVGYKLRRECLVNGSQVSGRQSCGLSKSHLLCNRTTSDSVPTTWLYNVQSQVSRLRKSLTPANKLQVSTSISPVAYSKATK